MTFPYLTLYKRDMLNAWCVYEHHLHDAATGVPTVIYVGACHLRDVYTLADGMRNSEWVKLVTDDAYLTVRIVSTGDRHTCRTGATAHMRTLPAIPVCNAKGFTTSGMSRGIVCNNGMTYLTQDEAAQALGLSQGAISLHLRGRLPHVKGFTFKHKDAPQ